MKKNVFFFFLLRLLLLGFTRVGTDRSRALSSGKINNFTYSSSIGFLWLTLHCCFERQTESVHLTLSVCLSACKVALRRTLTFFCLFASVLRTRVVITCCCHHEVILQYELVELFTLLYCRTHTVDSSILANKLLQLMNESSINE